jgi:hypothetical protein
MTHTKPSRMGKIFKVANQITCIGSLLLRQSWSDVKCYSGANVDSFFPQPTSARWRSNDLSSFFRNSSGAAFSQWSRRAIKITPQAEQRPEISRSLFGPIWRTSTNRGERSTVILQATAALDKLSRSYDINAIQIFMYDASRRENAILMALTRTD